MAYMFLERNSGTSTIDYPMSGSGAIVDALIRGGWVLGGWGWVGGWLAGWLGLLAGGHRKCTGVALTAAQPLAGTRGAHRTLLPCAALRPA